MDENEQIKIKCIRTQNTTKVETFDNSSYLQSNVDYVTVVKLLVLAMSRWLQYQ
jgi:hypothetical protein